MDSSRFYRPQSRGSSSSYKQIHETKEDWPLEAPRMMADAQETSHHQPWMSRSLSATGSPANGGFLLATNLSGTAQQTHLSHSLSSSSLTSGPQPSSPSSLSPNPPLPPAFWGEVTEETRGGEKERVRDGVKWPLRPLWHDGWRPEGIICTIPRLLQHPSPSLAPLEQSNLPLQLDHPRDRRGHNPVLHSTDLQQHILEVEQISIMSGTNLAASDLPPLPERFGSSDVRKGFHGDHLGTDATLLTTLTLDPNSVALLLRKSAAAICCHAGYHSASLRALDTLAGVLGDFLGRLSRQLAIHNDHQQSCSNSSGLLTGLGNTIQDPLERSLWCCGIQGKAELHQFWEKEVVAGARQLQREAAQLHEQPATPSSLTNLPPRPRKPLSLSLSSWTDIEGSDRLDEELSLEEALVTDMSIIAPATTPDPGAVQTFLPDLAMQEPSEFMLLTADLPRKRLRTGSSFTE